MFLGPVTTFSEVFTIAQILLSKIPNDPSTYSHSFRWLSSTPTKKEKVCSATVPQRLSLARQPCKWRKLSWLLTSSLADVISLTPTGITVSSYTTSLLHSAPSRRSSVGHSYDHEIHEEHCYIQTMLPPVFILYFWRSSDRTSLVLISIARSSSANSL